MEERDSQQKNIYGRKKDIESSVTKEAEEEEKEGKRESKEFEK